MYFDIIIKTITYNLKKKGVVMNYNKPRFIYLLIFVISLFIFQSLIAQNKTKKLFQDYKQEVKTRLLQRYQDKLSEQEINSLFQRHIKIDSISFLRKLTQIDNIKTQKQKIIMNKKANDTKSKYSTTAVNVQDSLALVALYNSTDGDNWYYNDNWLTGSVKDWYGVTVSNGYVTYLELAANNLTGFIPPELGNLTNLNQLIIYGNPLTGSIPKELGNLSNLHRMHLGDNWLTGSIPSELGNLTKLERLVLWENQLSGSIPPELGNLTNMQDLALNCNQFTGSIPSALENLSNLNNLFLDHNKLNGFIPPELGNLSNLGTLYLEHNQLSGTIPPELGNLTNLEILWGCIKTRFSDLD